MVRNMTTLPGYHAGELRFYGMHQVMKEVG